MARGNGKTEFFARLGAAVVAPDGPLRQSRAEVIVLAARHKQARIAFASALAVLRPYIDRDKRANWSVQDTINTCEVTHRPSGRTLRALAGNSDALHGLRPALSLLDEPSRWARSDSEARLTAIETAAGKLPGAKLCQLGTLPATPAHWFTRELTARRRDGYRRLYAARPRLKWDGMAAIRAANPSYDHLPTLQREIAAHRKRARSEAAQRASYEALRLNRGTDEVITERLVPVQDWLMAEGDAPAEGRYILSLDLSSVNFSGMAAYWPESGRAEGFYGVSSEPDLAERGRRLGVGTLYIECEQRGELVVTEGRVVDVEQLVTEAVSRWGMPACLTFDRFRRSELRQVFDRLGLQHVPQQPRGLLAADADEDIRALQLLLAAGDIRPRPSLALRDSLRNSRIKATAQGRFQFLRMGEGRDSSPDDLAVALTLAAGVAAREPLIRRPSQRRKAAHAVS